MVEVVPLPGQRGVASLCDGCCQNGSMRNGEYDGHIRARDDLRGVLAEELADWFAGDHTEYQAGRVTGLAGAIARLQYAGHELEEIRKATPAAHRINTHDGRPCACGTKKKCGVSPPLPFPAEDPDDEDFDEDEDEDEDVDVDVDVDG
jgi:hypothetical protein